MTIFFKYPSNYYKSQFILVFVQKSKKKNENELIIIFFVCLLNKNTEYVEIYNSLKGILKMMYFMRGLINPYEYSPYDFPPSLISFDKF